MCSLIQNIADSMAALGVSKFQILYKKSVLLYKCVLSYRT